MTISYLLKKFVAPALLKWMTDQQTEAALIESGKPWQTGVAESFNSKSVTSASA